MLCVLILYINGRTYSLKSTPNNRFFEKLFMAGFYLLPEFLPEICREEIAEEILFVFCFDVWPGTPTLAFRLIGQYVIFQTTATGRIVLSNKKEIWVNIQQLFGGPCIIIPDRQNLTTSLITSHRKTIQYHKLRNYRGPCYDTALHITYSRLPLF